MFTLVQRHQIEDLIITDAKVDINADIQQSKILNLETDLSAKLNKAGGVMSGFLTLHDDPSDPLHAVTKRYVDSLQGGDGKLFVGAIIPFVSLSNIPQGWLVADGSAVSRTIYTELFNLMGTTFGEGDGVTTFNLPDLRGRTIIGLDNMGGVSANRVTNPQADLIGGTGGAATHTLTITEMPAHTHTAATPAVQGAGPGNAVANAGSGITGSTGGGQPHNNMQPYMALNYLIKATAASDASSNINIFDWTFNEGSGNIINDIFNSKNLALSGTFTWGSGFLTINGGAGANTWQSQTNEFTDLESFSVVNWVTFNSVNTSGDRSVFILGDGNNFANSFAFSIDTKDGTGALRFNISNGSVINSVETTGNFVPSTGTKYMIVTTYNRVGGSSNNIARIRLTSDGTTWYENTNFNTGLMVLNSNFFLSNKHGTSGSQDVNYHRTTLYDGKILNDIEMQVLFSAGSETVIDLSGVSSGLLPPGYISGDAFKFLTSNTVQIPNGFKCRDSSNIADIVVDGNITVDINSSGINGLDQGTKVSDSWYYLYVIKNTATGVVGGLLSLDSSNPTLPAGFNRKRRIPIALRTDNSGNLIPTFIESLANDRALVKFKGVNFKATGTSAGPTNVLFKGTSNTYADINCANVMPPISQLGIFYFSAFSTTAGPGHAFFRTKGSLIDELDLYAENTSIESLTLTYETDANQRLEYKVTAPAEASVTVLGFYIPIN